MTVGQKNEGRYSTKSIYDSYRSGNDKSGNMGRFETRQGFRDGFSCYDMHTMKIKAGELSKWDVKNCSGIPVDYDPNAGILFVDGSDAHTLLIGATGSKKAD